LKSKIDDINFLKKERSKSIIITFQAFKTKVSHHFESKNKKDKIIIIIFFFLLRFSNLFFSQLKKKLIKLMIR